MIEVLIVIALFISLSAIVNMTDDTEPISQWPRPWDKSKKRYKL